MRPTPSGAQPAKQSPLTKEEIAYYLKRLPLIPQQDQAELLNLLLEAEKRERIVRCKGSFIEYIKHIWPKFISGKHHLVMADAFDRIAEGKLKRLMIAMPPRHTKSEFGSIHLPSWYLGKYPDRKVIQCSNTADLAVGFGRKVRDLIKRDEYAQVFPNVNLKDDSRAAGRWNTNHHGEYYAIGTGGTVTGLGADLLIIDDPHSEQQAKSGNPKIYDEDYEWFMTGPRQRLQPDGCIVIIACVAEGQRVLMGDGRWVPIESVAAGDFVSSYSDGSLVSRRVVASIPQGEDDILRVTSRSCSLDVNKDHPFLVVVGGLKTSAKTQEDVIKSRDWHVEWKRAGDLVEGDTIVTVKSMPSGNYHRPMRPDKRRQMTGDDYWTIGFMFGDGWLINSGKRGVTGFCVAVSVYDDLNKKVEDNISSLFGKRGTNTKFGYMRWDSKSSGQWLSSIGFSSGAKTKRVPEWVFRLRPCDKRKFLLGFFEADGWKREAKSGSGSWKVGIANRDLLDDLRLLARTCAVRCSKIYSYKVNAAQAPHSKHPIDTEVHSCSFAFKHDMAELRSRYKRQTTGNQHQNFRFEDVESIESVGRSNVYDLTIDGSENFIAEGCVVHNTRWSKRDLIGRLLEDQEKKPDADKWEYIQLPAITYDGKSMWPEFWPLGQLEALKASLPPYLWSAQYQQNPTSAVHSIVPAQYWRKWEAAEPPKCEYVIQSWDTAYEKSQRADYSACVTIGVFQWRNDEGVMNMGLILLDAFKDKYEFPELKRKARVAYKYWNPDTLLIEAKAAGSPLVHELRRSGIPATAFNPVGRGDKTLRLNSVSDLFRSGMVWAPDESWASDVITELSDFPAGAHDDYVDALVQALIRFRQGGLVRMPGEDEDEKYIPRPKADYY